MSIFQTTAECLAKSQKILTGVFDGDRKITAEEFATIVALLPALKTMVNSVTEMLEVDSSSFVK